MIADEVVVMVKSLIVLLFAFPIPTWAAAREYQQHVRLISSSKIGAEIAGDNYHVRLRFIPDPQMVLGVDRPDGQHSIGAFPLEGFVDTEVSGHSLPSSSVTFLGYSVKNGADVYTITILYSSPLWKERKVVLKFYPDFFTYAISLTGPVVAQEVHAIYYAAAAGRKAAIDYGVGDFKEMFSWTPDLYDALLPEKGMSRVGISTHEPRGKPGYLRGYHAGSPLVPPYVVAIRSGSAWWGIGTPGIPAASNGLEMLIGRRSLALPFQIMSRISPGDKGLQGPTVGFYFSSKPAGILESYNSSLVQMNQQIASPIQVWPDWWSGPIYCTWGDQAYAARMQTGTLEEADGGHYVTEKKVDKWLGVAAREHLPFRIVILDLGWMLDYGDFKPNPRQFSNLRSYIDRLHAKGLHVLLWIPMYEASGKLFNPDQKVSEIAQAHPEWLVHDQAGHTTDIFDYTNPKVREYVSSRIKYLLSSNTGDLNADGLKVDFMDRVPDPATSVFHDPSWGTGEVMSAKVLELIYKAAKNAKPDALIDSSFMNPLFHPWEDIVRLNDDVSNSVDTYWWRAWAAAANGVKVIDGDDWWAMEGYFVPLTLAKAAWGIPDIYALEYRGALGTEGQIGGISSIASGGFPVEITEDSYRRVRAILDVYLHAPATNVQKPHVNPTRHEASREYTSGPLTGFFAATTLNFGHALVTYTPQSAWAMSTVDESLSVPLPTGFHPEKIFAVDFGGHKASIPFSKEQPHAVQFTARDSAVGIDHYIIEYAAAKPK
jgi:hypothetical protein